LGISIGELQEHWKFVINHVRKTPNTFLLKKDRCQCTVSHNLIHSSPSFCNWSWLTSRAMRWLWAHLYSSQKVLASQNHISLMKRCTKSQMSLFFCFCFCFFFFFIYGRLVAPIYTQHFYEQWTNPWIKMCYNGWSKLFE